MKKKNRIVTIQILHSSVNIGKETVKINPLTLFMRLVVVAERNPESEITDYFSYKLCPYPMSLFKDGIMRSAQKSKHKRLSHWKVSKQYSNLNPLGSLMVELCFGAATGRKKNLSGKFSKIMLVF